MSTELAAGLAEEIASRIRAEDDLTAKVHLYKLNAIISIRQLHEGRLTRNQRRNGMHAPYDWHHMGNVSIGGRGMVEVEIRNPDLKERIEGLAAGPF